MVSPVLTEGPQVAGTDASWRQRSERQSLCPPLDCPYCNWPHLLYPSRYRLGSNIQWHCMLCTFLLSNDLKSDQIDLRPLSWKRVTYYLRNTSTLFCLLEIKRVHIVYLSCVLIGTVSWEKLKYDTAVLCFSDWCERWSGTYIMWPVLTKGVISRLHQFWNIGTVSKQFNVIFESSPYLKR